MPLNCALKNMVTFVNVMLYCHNFRSCKKTQQQPKGLFVKPCIAHSFHIPLLILINPPIRGYKLLEPRNHRQVAAMVPTARNAGL